MRKAKVLVQSGGTGAALVAESGLDFAPRAESRRGTRRRASAHPAVGHSRGSSLDSESLIQTIHHARLAAYPSGLAETDESRAAKRVMESA